MARVNARSLARMRRSMQRRLAGGFERAVFAAPRSTTEPATEEVVNGPGQLEADAFRGDLLEEWVHRAEQAAQRGLLKHTYVVGPTRRVVIDARHGAAKIKDVDEDTVTRMMGGKERALRPDEDAALLRAIGILSADGSMNVRHARKYKQVSHFIELCRPAWEAARARRAIDAEHPLFVVDLACGNAYLTFVLTRALQQAGVPARVLGIERNEPMVERARETAASLGFSELSFEAGTIAQARRSAGDAPDMVLALHACDTASDEAIDYALNANAAAILVAPCCQATLARELEAHGPHPEVAALLRHGLLRREYAAVLTDARRAQRLDDAGYHVDVLEFTASAHTSKNLLLRARRK